MSITVAEAMKIGGLRNSRLLAGGRNIKNIIKFIDSMEVPDIEPWLRSHELLLTTAYVIKDDIPALNRLVESLARVNAAGLGIKPRFLNGIPDEVIKTAEALGLPLIEIPAEVPFIEITHPLMKAILGRQARYLEFSEQAHRALTKVELEGAGLQAIAETFRHLVGSDVIVCNEALEITAYAGSAPLAETGLPIKIDDGSEILRTLNGTGRVHLPGVSWSICARPVRVKQTPCGYVLVSERNRPLNEMELIALEHACTTVALEILKSQAVEEARNRVERDFLADLFAGHFHSADILMQRAEALGIKLGKTNGVLVVDIDHFERLVRENGEEWAQEIKSKLVSIVRACLGNLTPPPLITSQSDSVSCLIHWPGGGQEKEKRLKQQLMDRGEKILARVASELPSVGVSIGVSGPFADIMRISDEYAQARTAIRIARRVWGPGHCVHVCEVAAYRLFYNSPLGGEFNHYCREKLGPLEEYDSAGSSNLTATLKAVIDCQGNRTEAAKRLFLHRNTLIYRIHQIERILDVDLSNHDHFFELMLAMKLKPLVGPTK